MDGLNQICRTRYGNVIFNKNDSIIGSSLISYGEWAQQEIDLINCFIAPGQTILDIGGHIGTHALFFSKTVGPQGHVYSFEPQRLLFQLLCANMALNDITWATCLPYAVGSHNGTINVPFVDYSKHLNFAGLALGGNDGTLVPLITVDSLNLSHCHFMKLDVETMEREVLIGATQTIKKFAPIIYLENRFKAYSDALIAYLENDLQYKALWHIVPPYNPNNFYGNPTDIFLDGDDSSMLCLPPSYDLAQLPPHIKINLP